MTKAPSTHEAAAAQRSSGGQLLQPITYQMRGFGFLGNGLLTSVAVPKHVTYE
jgi:hypothetical protein